MSAFSTVRKKLPATVLQPIVKEYVYRRVRVNNALPVVKAMPLRWVSSIDFFTGAPYETIHCETGAVIPFARCTIRGPRTHKKNYIRIHSGDFSVFSIRLQPAGLYRLLGIPAAAFTDEAVDAACIPVPGMEALVEQLMVCTDIDSCIAVVEPFLLSRLQKNEARVRGSVAVQKLAAILHTRPVPPAIKSLQQQLALSLRQLERNFVKEVGVTPKVYSRMVRFTNLLAYRKEHPECSWASLAYEFNYADQMHLIKDFKAFLGVNPSAFVMEDFAF